MAWSILFYRNSVRFYLLVVLGLTAWATTAMGQMPPPGPVVTVFSPPQNLSNNPGDSIAHQIAIDRQGNINVVWLDSSPGYRAVFFSRSIDRGVTFSGPQNLSNDPGGATPANIAVDSAGTIYVVWAGWSTNGGFLTRSSDGSTFSAPVKIADNMSWTPTITLDPGGRIYFAWQDGSRYQSLFFSQSSDGGGTFASPILLSTISPFGSTPLLGVDTSGNIDVVWEGCFSNCQIWFSGSKDGGAAFSQQIQIGTVFDFHSPLAMAIGSNGDLNVVFNTVPYGSVYLSRSTDGGTSFTSTNVSNNSNQPFTSPTDARIAIDSKGDIDVGWEDNSGVIFFSTSTDQGGTFSSSVISNGVVSNFDPQIVLDSSDNINLVWTGYSSGSYDVFFSRSNDGGTTFSMPQKLSNNTGSSSPTPQIALDFLGNPSVTWTDYSTGNADIFFTGGVTLQLPPGLPKTIPSLP